MDQLSFAKQLLMQLNQQRSKGYLCDVIIVVENALFRAHKNVLSASSRYFKSLLLHDNLINLDTEIIRPNVFKQVLDFIYTGSVPHPDRVSDQGVADLLAAASYLQVSHLAAFCHRRLRAPGSGRTTPPTSSTDLLQAPPPNGHLPLIPYPSSNNPRTNHGHHLSAMSTGVKGAERRRTAQEGHHRSRDTGSKDEVFSSRWASLHPFEGGEMVDTSSVEMMRDLGLDLTRKSPTVTGLPTGVGAATEEVSFLNGLMGPSHPPGSNTPTSTNTSPASPDLRRQEENTERRHSLLRRPKSAAERQQRAAHHRKRARASGGGEGPSLPRALLNGQPGRSLEEEEARDEMMVHGEDDGASPEERAGDLGPAQEEEVSANHMEPCCGDIISIQRESEEGGAATCSYPRFPPGGHDDDDEPPVGDNLYVCIPCGRGFSSSEQLNAHVESHTAEELCVNVKEEEEEDMMASRPPCDIWRPHQAGGPAPVDPRSGNTDVKDEEEEEEEDAADPEKNPPEDDHHHPTKEEETDAERSLLHHRHVCSVCNQRYEDAASLRQHERSRHWPLAGAAPARASFPCALCGKLFTQRGTMTRHMRSHLGLKPFGCPECGMRFTRQYRLTEHARVHSGEKPYECRLCGGRFTQQRNLISHLRMHTLQSAS